MTLKRREKGNNVHREENMIKGMQADYILVTYFSPTHSVMKNKKNEKTKNQKNWIQNIFAPPCSINLSKCVL